MDPAPHVAQRQIIKFIRTRNDCSKININHTGSKHTVFELGLAMFGLVYLAKLEAPADMIKNNHPINQCCSVASLSDNAMVGHNIISFPVIMADLKGWPLLIRLGSHISSPENESPNQLAKARFWSFETASQ